MEFSGGMNWGVKLPSQHSLWTLSPACRPSTVNQPLMVKYSWVILTEAIKVVFRTALQSAHWWAVKFLIWIFWINLLKQVESCSCVPEDDTKLEKVQQQWWRWFLVKAEGGGTRGQQWRIRQQTPDLCQNKHSQIFEISGKVTACASQRGEWCSMKLWVTSTKIRLFKCQVGTSGSLKYKHCYAMVETGSDLQVTWESTSLLKETSQLQ